MATTLRHIWDHPGTRDRRVRSAGRYAGWQLWQRAVRRPLSVRIAGDLRLRCYPHSTSASAVLYTGLPDWEEMHFLLHVLRPDDVFVDVGANIGVYTLLAASVPGVRVVAFEPAGPAFERLTENVVRNDLAGVTLRRTAVGDTDGTVQLTRGLDSVNHVVQADGHAAATETVPVRRLDDLVAGAGPVAVVKIDVEGYEAEVLRGAGRLLAEQSPALVVEWNDGAALAELLEDAGYRAYRYDPETRRLTEADLRAPAGPNVIACRDPARWEDRCRRQAMTAVTT